MRRSLDRLEEACQIIRSLWTQPCTTFDGAHYRLDGAIAEPKPVQRPHPPIWIGGPVLEQYAAAGAAEAILITTAGTAQRQAEELAALLPRLRTIG